MLLADGKTRCLQLLGLPVPCLGCRFVAGADSTLYLRWPTAELTIQGSPPRGGLMARYSVCTVLDRLDSKLTVLLPARMWMACSEGSVRSVRIRLLSFCCPSSCSLPFLIREGTWRDLTRQSKCTRGGRGPELVASFLQACSIILTKSRGGACKAGRRMQGRGEEMRS